MNDYLLDINDLSIEYVVDKKVSYAVNHIDIKLKKGEILGLVGETGAGKTTTALSIMKLLPTYISRASSGSITFEGTDILNADDATMQKIRGDHVSMIFQDPMTSLNPLARVGNQVGDSIRLHNPGLKNYEVEKKVDEIFLKVGLPPSRKNEFPHQFSGGMKQRIMIAIAIACEPDLLIADEPTTALDVTIQAQVIKMMRELQQDLKSSVILITHDLGLVANFCDKVAIMYAGEIVESGSLEEIFDFSAVHHPYTNGLFNSIPRIDSDAERLESIPGMAPDPRALPDGCKFHPRCKYCEDRCKSGEVPAFTQGSKIIKCWRAAGEEI